MGTYLSFLGPGYDAKLQPGRGGEAVRGISKYQLTSTKSAQMAGTIHSATGGLVGAIKPSKPLCIVGIGKRSTAEPNGWWRMNCDSYCNQRGGNPQRTASISCTLRQRACCNRCPQEEGGVSGEFAQLRYSLTLCSFFLLKPYGEVQMTTEAGGGYCWKPLAMNLHVAGLGVMVALMSTWSDKAAHHGTALLSLEGEGKRKGFLNKAHSTWICS